ncbi:hypothetical protein [Phenylobacterium sp.]|uniref:hypothetical protein n=1 Tax=Phenylobacterium sp. TaxID=1871053 RepID=UPI0019BD5812|nr:hypothetical protein [Phenylobacterium sp.]MBC7168706.1 hypothetical protein [Phenylobacterium sp.]
MNARTWPAPIDVWQADGRPVKTAAVTRDTAGGLRLVAIDAEGNHYVGHQEGDAKITVLCGPVSPHDALETACRVLAGIRGGSTGRDELTVASALVRQFAEAERVADAVEA